MILSIVIPVYNVSEYLEGCVRSVLSSDCSDCEIILVDDGSTDGKSPALCDQLAAERPDLIRVIHQENLGLGGARNTGLEAASGDYLFFLDSDDTVTENAIDVMKKAIARTHADIVAFNFLSDDGEGHLTPGKASYVEPQGAFTLAKHPEFLLSLPTAWCRLWKRDLFLESGIRYPSRVWYEDIRTSMKLFALASSIVTIPDHLYRYLQRPGSIMHSAKLDRNHEIIDALDDVLGWYQDQGLFTQYEACLEQLCISHVLLAASVRVLMADPSHPLLREFSDYVQKHFPNYRQNPYTRQLSKPRQLAVKLLEHHHYRLLRLMFRIKGTA